MDFKEYRADGWPICPRCEEDELWSPLRWDGEGEKPPIQAYIDAGLTCYLCGWTNTNGLLNALCGARQLLDNINGAVLRSGVVLDYTRDLADIDRILTTEQNR